MNLKILGDHSNLKEIHKYIYLESKEELIEEEYKSTPGFHSEPIVIGLLAVLTPTIIAGLNAFVKYKKNSQAAESENRRIENEKINNDQLYELEKLKLIITFKKGKSMHFKIDEIDKVEKLLLDERLDNSNLP